MRDFPWGALWRLFAATADLGCLLMFVWACIDHDQRLMIQFGFLLLMGRRRAQDRED